MGFPRNLPACTARLSVRPGELPSQPPCLRSSAVRFTRGLPSQPPCLRSSADRSTRWASRATSPLARLRNPFNPSGSPSPPPCLHSSMTHSTLEAASATRLLAQPGHSHNLLGELAQLGHLRSRVAARPWSLARPVRDHSANMGPCDASQPTLTRPPTRPCGHTFNRPGLPLPARHAS